MASLAFMMAAASLTGAPHPPVHRIIVAPDGRVSTISAALRQARAGDTIVVTAGVYREPRLEVRMPLVILGEGVAVLDAGGAHEALTIKADDVTIRGLTIRNVLPSFVEDRAGIRLDGVRGCRVEGNHLVDTFFDGSAEKTVAALLGGENAKLTDEELDRIADLITPGASLIVSDNKLSGETGNTTDFIIETK